MAAARASSASLAVSQGPPETASPASDRGRRACHLPDGSCRMDPEPVDLFRRLRDDVVFLVKRPFGTPDAQQP